MINKCLAIPAKVDLVLGFVSPFIFSYFFASITPFTVFFAIALALTSQQLGTKEDAVAAPTLKQEFKFLALKTIAATITFTFIIIVH